MHAVHSQAYFFSGIMPTATRHKNGTWTIIATYQGRRCQITLGKVERAKALLFQANLELLCDQKRYSQSLTPDLLHWISGLTPKHRSQLAQIGLIADFNPNLTVGELIEVFLEDYELRSVRKEVKASSLTQFNSAMQRFPASFKLMKLSEIQPRQKTERTSSKPIFESATQKLFVEINSWQRNHYAVSSWSRANGRIREIGKWAVDRGYCDHNPFVLLPKPKQVEDSRNVYVERAWIDDAMAQCHHPDTRLLFVLGRYCGFRLLSEARTLKPQHVDFENKILSVFDSKKQAFRQMPLFKLVADELVRHQDTTGWNRRYVLTPDTIEATDTRATDKMKAAVKKAGVIQWPRANQNLRSSCENDLLRQGFSERLVTAWLGHTVDVSRNHYQKLFAADFQEAVERSSY